MEASKSFAKRRQCPSQGNVYSTTRRCGRTTKRAAASRRLTISSDQSPRRSKSSRSLSPPYVIASTTTCRSFCPWTASSRSPRLRPFDEPPFRVLSDRFCSAGLQTNGGVEWSVQAVVLPLESRKPAGIAAFRKLSPFSLFECAGAYLGPIMGPNNSQALPLNLASCICLIGAKSEGDVLSRMPGSRSGI